MQFEVIGVDTENYYLMAFDRKMDMGKGVFFYKIPLSYFDKYVFNVENMIDDIIDVELHIEELYELLIDYGFLTIISQDDFMDIHVSFGGDY